MSKIEFPHLSPSHWYACLEVTVNFDDNQKANSVYSNLFQKLLVEDDVASFFSTSQRTLEKGCKMRFILDQLFHMQ